MGATTGLGLLWIFPITIGSSPSSRRWPPGSAWSPGRAYPTSSATGSGAPTAFAMIVLLVANVANTVAEFSGAAAASRSSGSRVLVVPIVGGRHLGAGDQGQLPDRRAGLPVGHRRVRGVHRVGDPGRPDWGAVGRALVTPSLDLRRPILLLMVAVVGTTITPYMQFYLTSAVAEKGIGEEELRLEQADAIGGSIWTNVIAIFIVVAAATTIGVAAGRSRRPRTRPGRWSRSPGGSPRRCSRSGCSGRACWRRRSCRSRPRS